MLNVVNRIYISVLPVQIQYSKCFIFGCIFKRIVGYLVEELD